uniref:NADH dehydrogenase subunit 6 n=1 Tax=Fulgoraria rupestris rupestris TaxID=3082331 RepID=UPI002A836409|nr:NADH dehydrogenase subunit 6 [Fulgoraria rupestris rupestris]WOJ51895.1 NADH dehydrogenase subunit 6 [Fulgoraria rupestris rupestris]
MSFLATINLTFFTFLLLPMMTQPLSLGLVIILSTLLMCIIASMTLSAWYSYILFLIYVGGLLVMFAYVAALSPNVLFGSVNMMLVFLVLIMPLSLFLYFYPFIDLSFMCTNELFMKLKFMKTYSMEMVSPHMISILIGLATILLVTLVVVVKICYYHHASLRPFMT